MKNGMRLNTLYQQAVFQATQHYASEVPLNAWLLLAMQEAQCWHQAREYTAYVQAGNALQMAIFATVSCHPRNTNELPIHHIVHPCTVPTILENGESVSDIDMYFDVVVDWFEEVGVRNRLAMDLADALLEDIDISIQFYNTLADPIPSVIRNGLDDH